MWLGLSRGHLFYNAKNRGRPHLLRHLPHLFSPTKLRHSSTSLVHTPHQAHHSSPLKHGPERYRRARNNQPPTRTHSLLFSPGRLYKMLSMRWCWALCGRLCVRQTFGGRVQHVWQRRPFLFTLQQQDLLQLWSSRAPGA